MEVKTIGVLGAGTMGAGIAQNAAQAGYQVILVDVDAALVERGTKGILKNLQKSVERGKLAEADKDAIVARISGEVSLASFSEVDVVIEAIIENINIKKKVFAELDTICTAHTILASNTSSLPITELAAATKRPDKVVGMHFFNPVPMMKLVEVIPGRVTSPETVAAVTELAKRLGKVPVNAKEAPGFIVNRILVPMLNEAVMALQEEIGTAQDIDTAMKLGAGMPMGPLALCDMVGNDIVLAVMEVFYQEFGDPKYRPATLLRQMVRAGHLGMKTGRGFYDYTSK